MLTVLRAAGEAARQRADTLGDEAGRELVAGPDLGRGRGTQLNRRQRRRGLLFDRLLVAQRQVVLVGVTEALDGFGLVFDPVDRATAQALEKLVACLPDVESLAEGEIGGLGAVLSEIVPE